MAMLDIFKKKQQPQPDPYAGKPLLKIIEAFVLDAIGELQPSQREAMERMTPKLQELYKSTSPWQGIVVEVMHWDPAIQTGIKALWDKNQGIARANGVSLSPAQFVVMFVDANVAHT